MPILQLVTARIGSLDVVLSVSMGQGSQRKNHREKRAHTLFSLESRTGLQLKGERMQRAVCEIDGAGFGILRGRNPAFFRAI